MMDFLHYFKKVGGVNKREDWDESITSARETISASSTVVEVLQGGIKASQNPVSASPLLQEVMGSQRDTDSYRRGRNNQKGNS